MIMYDCVNYASDHNSDDSNEPDHDHDNDSDDHHVYFHDDVSTVIFRKRRQGRYTSAQCKNKLLQSRFMSSASSPPK